MPLDGDRVAVGPTLTTFTSVSVSVSTYRPHDERLHLMHSSELYNGRTGGRIVNILPFLFISWTLGQRYRLTLLRDRVGRVDRLGESLLKTLRRGLLDRLGDEGGASGVRDGTLVFGGVGVMDLGLVWARRH